MARVLGEKELAMWLGILLVIALVLAILAERGCDRPTDGPTPARAPAQLLTSWPLAQLDALESDLRSWAEGRWEDVSVEYDGASRTVSIWAIVDRNFQPNDVALTGYCRVIGESVRKQVQGVNWDAEIRHRGNVVKRCP